MLSTVETDTLRVERSARRRVAAQVPARAGDSVRPAGDVEQNAQFRSAVQPGTRQGDDRALGIFQLEIEKQIGFLRERRGVWTS